MSKNIMDFWPFPEFKPRHSQIKALEWLVATQHKKYQILEMPVGCHKKGTEVLMFDGTFKVVEHIQVGEVVMGPDSTPRIVQQLHTGVDEMFNITPLRGDPFVVNKKHILSLITTPCKRAGFDGKRVINISVEDYLKSSKDFTRHVKLYRSNGITFSQDVDLPIDPYMLGALLGDGTIHSGVVVLTSMDPELAVEAHIQAKKHDMIIIERDNQQSKAKNYHFTSKPIPGQRRINNIQEILRSLGVYDTKSGTKFIPSIYKTASQSDRLQILAGMIDTDGYYKSSFHICTKSVQLKDDIQFIARSLGFTANIFTRRTKLPNKEEIRDYYEVVISGDLDTIPTKLPRKQAKPRKQKKRHTVSGFNVVPDGSYRYYGFTLDGDHLYMLKDFTITHNCGKSYVASTYARYLSNSNEKASFTLTPQKILQKQYEADFKGKSTVSLYGKSNYSCSGKGTTCDIGSIVKPRCSSCPHKTAKEIAVKSNHVILNYKLALTAFAFTSTFKERSLLVADECHTLERHLVDFDALQISYARCKKYNLQFKVHKELNEAVEWMGDYYMPKLTPIFNALEVECEYLKEKAGSDLTRKDINKIREFDKLTEHVEECHLIMAHTEEYMENNYVLVWDKTMFQFKRLTGGYSFNNILKPMADNMLFMSSTILNKDGFCEDLQIPKDETAFLSLDSEFNKDNRPVYYMPRMKMNYTWNKPENKKSRDEMIGDVKFLLDNHKEENGILHTANFQVAAWLVEELKNGPHTIYHHNPDSGDSRDLVIHAFLTDVNPRILISPSSTEGLDLKGDLGHFAIFVKTPYPYLGDQWIKRRMDLSSEWYQRQTLINIIQGGGRIVRSETDTGTVYIIDASFGYLYKTAHHMIPRWWKDSYTII